MTYCGRPVFVSYLGTYWSRIQFIGEAGWVYVPTRLLKETEPS